MRLRRVSWRSWIVLAIILVAAGAAGGVFLRRDSNTAVPSPPPSSAEMAEAQSMPTDPSVGGSRDGRRYVIVPSESRALYRVGETFLRFDRPGVAVGVTQAISGELSMDVEQSTEGVFGMVRVDLSELTSDEPRRDRAIREQWLQSAQFPIAEFRPTGLELHAPYQDGQELPVTVHGELTIRNLTRPTAWTGSLILEGDTLRSTVTTQIRMTEYGFEPPSVLGVLRAEDEASIEVEIVARRDDS